MEFEKIWIEPYQAARRIRHRFGLQSALDYLVGEKLLQFAADLIVTLNSLKNCPGFKQQPLGCSILTKSPAI